MTETVIEAIDDPSEETEEPIPQAEETKLAFKIETLDDFKRLLAVVSGLDPDAQQAIARFLDLDSKVQKSFFPDRTVTLAIGQLKGFGNALYGDAEDNPYDVCAEVLCDAFMGYKGFKSNQFVDMTRQTPNLEALKTAADDVKQGLAARILGRGKGE